MTSVERKREKANWDKTLENKRVIIHKYIQAEFGFLFKWYVGHQSNDISRQVLCLKVEQMLPVPRNREKNIVCMYVSKMSLLDVN